MLGAGNCNYGHMNKVSTISTQHLPEATVHWLPIVSTPWWMDYKLLRTVKDISSQLHAPDHQVFLAAVTHDLPLTQGVVNHCMQISPIQVILLNPPTVHSS